MDHTKRNIVLGIRNQFTADVSQDFKTGHKDHLQTLGLRRIRNSIFYSFNALFAPIMEPIPDAWTEIVCLRES